ncbi:MAG: hypothetical protein OXI63_23225 [Candidatus Poribacteria bacterium]|nr:hypothetical protein [Candidatus Poribacteria bacterium]
MARAHLVNPMSGHLGAGVVAGFFIAENQPNLDEYVCSGIEAELDRIIHGQSTFSPKRNAAVSVAEMFESFPKQPSQENLIDGIADALARNIDQTRQSGHNVIFAAIAIRALKHHPEFATPAITDGIRKLIAGFNGVTPGVAYYGKERGRIDGRNVALPEEDTCPPYTDLQTMATTVIDTLIQYASERRQGYGGLWHVINHAAALSELAQCGYEELAIMGLTAHHQHIRLWRTLPNVADELGPETPTKYDPRLSVYWQSGDLRRDRARLTHRIKTLYGFDTLVKLVNDKAKHEQGYENIRYLM